MFFSKKLRLASAVLGVAMLSTVLQAVAGIVVPVMKLRLVPILR